MRTTPSSGMPRRVATGLAALAALLALAVCPGPARAATFADVPASHPQRLAIEVMAQLGIVSGFADGSFRPDEPVTRQQFAKMVVLAMRLPVSEDDVSPFVDVPVSGPGSLFPDNYIAAVAREGITTGAGGSSSGGGPSFKPGDRITLAQVVTMMTRAAGRPLAQPPAGYRSVWGDFDVSHGPTARVAQYNGLLRYTPALTSSPWKTATRAETAALLFNLMGTDPEGMNGLFLGSSTDLVQYFLAKGHTGEKFSVPLAELAKLYVLLGRRFGIRADMAWAQMVHETGFGEYGGDVLPEQNNMAGIGATGGVPGNSFATAELGIIAQYAHLAWYIYPDHLDDPYCAPSSDPSVPGDPRHFVIDGRPHRGNVRTVLDLGGKWAPGPAYGAAVLNHQQGIVPTVGW